MEESRLEDRGLDNAEKWFCSSMGSLFDVWPVESMTTVLVR